MVPWFLLLFSKSRNHNLGHSVDTGKENKTNLGFAFSLLERSLSRLSNRRVGFFAIAMKKQTSADKSAIDSG